MQVLNQLKDTVTLGWSRPSSDGGDKIQGYIIEYKKVGDGHWEKYNTKPIEDVQGKGMVCLVITNTVMSISALIKIEFTCIILFSSVSVSPNFDVDRGSLSVCGWDKRYPSL